MPSFQGFKLPKTHGEQADATGELIHAHVIGIHQLLLPIHPRNLLPSYVLSATTPDYEAIMPYCLYQLNHFGSPLYAGEGSDC